jgi:hypothetical protein
VATVVGILIGLGLLLVTLPQARRAGRLDGDPATTRLVRWGLVLKLVSAPAYLVVIGAVYHGGDYGLYSQNGALIAHAYRSGNFSPHLEVLKQYSSVDNFVSYVTGWIYAIFGVTEMGAFIVFSWFAFLGQYFFYRAFRIAVPGGDRTRYGRLIFLFPSVLFWTATIGKDAIIFFGIGLASLGIARAFAKRRGGFVILAIALVVIMAVRPNIALTIFVGLVPAYLVGRAPRGKKRKLGSRVVGVALLLVIGSLLVPRAQHFLGISNFSLTSINNRLKRVSSDTSNAGSQNFGTTASSANTPTVIDDPLRLPLDVVTVLYRPFPYEAPTIVTLAASLESLFLVALTAASWRRVLAAARRISKRPYIGFSLFYTAVFIATFASVGNFGILARERVQTLPAYFVLLAAVPPERRRPAQALPPSVPATRRQPALPG